MHHPLLVRLAILLPLFSLFPTNRTAQAQGTINVDRARLLRNQAQIQQPFSSEPTDGVDQGYAAASPNDPDLGEQAILKRNERYKAFTLEVGSPFYYTSNVALVDHGQVDDVIIAPVAGLTLLAEARADALRRFFRPAAVLLLHGQLWVRLCQLRPGCGPGLFRPGAA